MSRQALIWARNIAAPWAVRGAALTFAMECGNDDYVFACSMYTLQSMTGGRSSNAIRLMINYLEKVGIVERLFGQGSRKGVRLRVCVDMSTDEINRRIRANPFHSRECDPQPQPPSEMSDDTERRNGHSDQPPS